MPKHDPFVLLDFPDGPRLFRRPKRIVEAWQPEELGPALDRLEGERCAGFMSYEAGLALDPALKGRATEPQPNSPPLLWFGVFEEETNACPLPDPAGAWLGAPRPRIGRDDFRAAIAQIQDHVVDGDIYQANFTYQADVGVQGHPLAIYAQLKSRAAPRWGAVVFTGLHWILSCSPELFFSLSDRRITTRPMKGTAIAGTDPMQLLSDEKQRSENLMIVDLMRNDLARVSEPGSVTVPELFTIEEYPTVLQMTSTVTSVARRGVRPLDVVKTIFPCGSVTGAPKIRAMQIIDDLEAEQRGPYTGSIGMLSGDAAEFSVAIRTLVMANGEPVARLGLGSGIVADSEADAEWDECAAKGAFVRSPTHFDLIETMRVTAGEVALLALHLDRLEDSARAFAFPFDRDAVAEAVAREAAGAEQARLRLTLSPEGALGFERAPLPGQPKDAEVCLKPRQVDPADFRLRHKTSLRDIYDNPLRAAGTFEVLFVDGDGLVTEGSFTNLFVRKGGVLVTPPCSRGLLPGVLRRMLIESGEAVEGDIHADELGEEVLVGNALRGLIPVNVRR